jgi:signal peptidase
MGRQRMKKTTEKHFWRSLGNWLSNAAVILVVTLAVLLAGVRLFGLTPYAVLSGSMEPVYPVGSLIYVQRTAPESIHVGEAITFVLNEELDIATHRVVKIDQTERNFVTKGDANETADGKPVSFDNLIGRPVFDLPYLGYFSHWISTPPGRYYALGGGVALLILVFLPDLRRWADRHDNAQKPARGQE